MSSFGTCPLCESEADLRESHVLPAFVFRWLRKRSITGHIRQSDAIDRRVQDGAKKPWLCAECEKLFGREEKAFADKLFYPWLNDATRLEYHGWLLRFCTSVSWRVLKHCKGLNPDHRYSDEEDGAAAEAEAVWRQFLLGRRSSIGRFEQHILPLGIIESTTAPSLPTNINRYLTGAIEMDIIGSSKMMMTYAKLGRFMLFGMIRKGRGPWEGTRVLAQHGYIGAKKFVLPYSLGDFINERAQHVQSALDDMSPVQVAKVDAAVIANVDRMAETDQFRAMLADAAMFGEEVIIRK